MLNFRNLSLQRKQMLVIMLTSTVSLLLACAAFVAYDVSRFRREMVESVSSLAEVVGNNTTAAIDFNKPLDAAETLGALRAEPNVVLARVHTQGSQTFATYAREGAQPPPEISRTLEARHEFTANHLHLFRPITQGGEQVGTIELVADLFELRERLWRYAGIAGLVLAASLLAAFGLSHRLQKLISDPILHLAQVARSVALEKDYAVRATKKSNDELGQLVDGFNEMLGQIQQRDAALQSASAELEVRVEERTVELANTNEALQTENTERKQADEKLRRTEALYRSAIAGAGAVPYSLDFQTKSYGYIGEGIQQLIGYAPHEMSGKLWDRIVQTSVMMGEAASLNKAEAARRVKAAELAHWRCDMLVTTREGKSRWISDASVQVRDESGQVTGSVGILQDITERKEAEAKLEDIHKQLVEASRRGGMAEIATNVLHNVGNVLNSVNISTGLIVESVKKSKASGLARVVALLREHTHDLGEFITTDAKGKQLPIYLAQLSEHLVADQVAMVGELDSLRRNVEHIKEIVAMQQSYATVGGVKEMINMVNLVEDSLRMNERALSRHGVEVIREFSNVPSMNVEKHKIMQILVNLVRNGKHACDDSERADKRLTVRVANGDGQVAISVIDNGVGIPAENLTRIFNHGFTTKKDGHGFGLHSGALAAKEMGGSLTVHSDGPGHGATFTLELPLDLASGNAERPASSAAAAPTSKFS